MNTPTHPGKGLIAGLAGGALSSLLMDCYWMLVEKQLGARPEQKPRPGDTNQKQERPATQVMADDVSKVLTGHKVPEKQKAAAGVAVHYAFGIFWGAVFGVLAARLPRLGLLAGLLYGAAIWLIGNEIALPALRVSPDRSKVPPSDRLQALGAHAVYGVGTAMLTRALLRRWS